MPYTKNDYPDSWKNFDEKVRNKAIEIANSMLEDDYEEDRAIPIATKKAKEWADEEGESGGEVKHLVEPHENGWSIRKKGGDKPSYVYDTKDEAMEKAREISKNQESEIAIYKKDGSLDKTIGPLGKES